MELKKYILYYSRIKMKCKYCKRELPNKDWRTCRGCLWCDWTYYRSQKEERKILAIIKILHDEL